MGHGIRDQLLQLVDEVEKLTTEVFEAVQEGNQAENLLELLMKKVVYILYCFQVIWQHVCLYEDGALRVAFIYCLGSTANGIAPNRGYPTSAASANHRM